MRERRLTTEIIVLITLMAAVIVAGSSQGGTAAFDNRELATYRLTAPVFERFEEASRLLAAATLNDPRYDDDPLFTREIALLGDAREMAAGLDARLQREPALAEALRTADISSREYTKFVLGLLAARLAHGFIAAGVMHGVADGPASDNVKFVDEHQQEVAAVLKALGIRDYK